MKRKSVVPCRVYPLAVSAQSITSGEVKR